MNIYLYVKTHNKTGLKYLGKTTAKDPHKYPGSGKYWKTHLATHGVNYTTEIIKECHSVKELKKWGLYYSNLWNVIESDAWANLKEEQGDGGAYPNSGKHMKTEKYRKLSSARANNPVNKESLRKRMLLNNPMNNLTFRNKISKALLGKPKSEEHKKNMFKPMLVPSIAAKRKIPIDLTIYTFINLNSGISVSTTQYEFRKQFNLLKGNVSALVHGHCKSYKGWVLQNSY